MNGTSAPSRAAMPHGQEAGEMRHPYPADLESLLICDVCGSSTTFSDRQLILEDHAALGWAKLFDPNHPCDYPTYLACPVCPESALPSLAQARREAANQAIQQAKDQWDANHPDDTGGR